MVSASMSNVTDINSTDLQMCIPKYVDSEEKLSKQENQFSELASAVHPGSTPVIRR